MSYCRWSSEDFGCDLYCYESNDGWVTHVASQRIEWTPPEGGTLYDLPKSDAGTADFEAWTARRKARSAAFDAAPMHPIGLPFDGKTFTDSTLEGFRERLLSLRAAGYQFGEYVIEAVDEEIAEATTP